MHLTKGTFMKKLAQRMLALFLCALASTAILTIGVEAHPPKVRHYGPFASTSPDSGTCGPDWANDRFKRSFEIDPNNPNVVIERFDDGRFVTIAGPSPNACVLMPPPNGNGNKVGADVTGKFSGSFDIKVSGGTFDPKAKCTPSACNTTAGFVKTIYGPSATFATGFTFFEFNYYTRENGSWHNASANHGGNQGDITGSPEPDTSTRHTSLNSLK
jgi:hypothetical protein